MGLLLRCGQHNVYLGLTCDVTVNCVFSVIVNTFTAAPAHQNTVPIVQAVFSEFCNAIIYCDGFDGSAGLVLWFWFDWFDWFAWFDLLNLSR